MTTLNTVEAGLTKDRSNTYSHTCGKKREIEPERQPLPSPAETLEYFDSEIRFAGAMRHIRAHAPVASKRFRYKRNDGQYRYAPALDIALLLWAGHSLIEIEEYLDCSRDSLRHVIRKLRAMGISIAPERVIPPKCQSPVRCAAQSPDKRLRLTDAVEATQRGEYAPAQLQSWLEKQTEYWDRSYESRHTSMGVGPEFERKIDWLYRTQTSAFRKL